jgi:hypothetical protein
METPLKTPLSESFSEGFSNMLNSNHDFEGPEKSAYLF